MKKILGFLLVCILGTASAFAISEKETTERVFSDIGSGTAHSEAILDLYSRGIIRGYEDGTFKPLKKINRAEFTKIIIEANFPGKALGQKCFSDVKDEWFAPFVCFAKGRSIVKGDPSGNFRPGNDINTAEAYKIVFETMLKNPIYDTKGEWYQRYLEYAEALSLAFSEDLNPTMSVTRGEMAEMIYLILQNNEIGEYEQAILDLTNVERKKMGLDPLSYNKILEKTAYLHAKDMHQRDFFSHVNPDGEDAEERMKPYYEDRQWTSRLTGENIWEWEKPISYNATDLAADVMNGNFGWMQSPAHRDNILNPNFLELGVGYYRAKNGKVFFVQNFGGMGF